MMFKTITDETTLSGQRIVGALQARKIAQQQATAQLEIDIACLKEYQVACQNGTVTTEQFDIIMHKASASAVEYSAKIKAGTGTAQSYANTQRATNSALQEVSIGAGIASKAVKLFSAALNMIAFTAITQGISWLIRKVDEWIVTAKEAKESANAFKESLSTFFSESQSNLKTISSLSYRFDELSKNVDDNGKKIGGTEEEYAEFLDICQQVGQVMPELITGYTNEGETIITLQGKVDSLTESYKEAIRTKAALFLSNGDEEGNSIKSFFEDYNDFVNGYQGVLGAKTSPSGQNTAEDFEEYYGYDKIHGWLSDVTDATLEDLESLRAGTTEYVYLARVLKEAGYEISEISAENYNAIHDVFNNRMSVMEKGVTDRVTNIRTAFQNMLYADSDYWKINDENVISAINSLYASIDDEFIKQNELFSQTALQTFESDFVSLFNNESTKQAMVDFYTPIANDESVQNYTDRINFALQEIQSYCDNNGIVIPIEVNNSVDTLVNNVKSKLKDEFDDRVGELKLEELQIAAEQIEVPENALLSWDELIDKIKEIQSSTLNNENPISSLSITETVDQINTQLKPAFDSLKSAYQDIFSLDENTGEQLFSLEDVSIETFESIRAELEKLGEIDGINVDYASFERFVSVLSDTSSTANEVQAQFDALATSIIYTTDCTNMSAETYDLLVKSLTEMGVTNADEVLTNLKDIQEELVSIGYDVANITAEEAAELIRLGAVSAETTEYLKMYLIQKQLAQNPLDTMADITALEGLCNALGVTGELYRYVIDLKRAFDAKEMGAVSDGLDSSIEHIKGKIEELANGQADFKFNFSAPNTSKKSGSSSSSKSEKDTTKEFDWIEQAIENVEKEIKNLDEVVNSAYSTFSQKNEALAKEIGKVSEEIDLQQQAYAEYMRKADSIGLPEHYKELVQNGTIGIEEITDENLQEQIDAYQKWYDKAINASDAIKELKTDMKDLYVSAYELQTDNLKERLDSDSITQKQYLEGLKAAYEQFYANLEDFAQQYHEAVLEYLDEEKGYLNDVAGAAASLLDREIDRIQDDADEQENRLKKQIDLLENRKKPLEDELDALEDKAKREEQILNLQKAQYALAMAENQRPKLVNYMPDTIVIQCVKVTITVKIRWDGQDRGKTVTFHTHAKVVGIMRQIDALYQFVCKICYNSHLNNL